MAAKLRKLTLEELIETLKRLAKSQERTTLTNVRDVQVRQIGHLRRIDFVWAFYAIT